MEGYPFNIWIIFSNTLVMIEFYRCIACPYLDFDCMRVTSVRFHRIIWRKSGASPGQSGAFNEWALAHLNSNWTTSCLSWMFLSEFNFKKTFCILFAKHSVRQINKEYFGFCRVHIKFDESYANYALLTVNMNVKSVTTRSYTFSYCNSGNSYPYMCNINIRALLLFWYLRMKSKQIYICYLALMGRFHCRNKQNKYRH